MAGTSSGADAHQAHTPGQRATSADHQGPPADQHHFGPPEHERSPEQQQSVAGQRSPWARPPVPTIPGYRDLVLHRRGSSAEVYRATMEPLDRTVAVKLLRLDEWTTYEQFQQELETAMRLSVKPHVVRILDTGTVDGRPYLAMEFCPDGSYAEIVENHGPLSIDDAVDVGIKISEALHCAHEAGIIHRDVTPGNILRSKFGPALTDFGIARRPTELHGTVTLNKLTPHYAAPEALLRQPQSVRSDVYSLGSTLWFLLVGHPPYAPNGERNPDPFIYRDLALQRPVPLMPRPDVPVWLQTEIARALAKQPEDRHPTAAGLGEALQRGWEAWKGRPWQPPASYPPLRPLPSGVHLDTTTSAPYTGPAPTVSPPPSGAPQHAATPAGSPFAPPSMRQPAEPVTPAPPEVHPPLGPASPAMVPAQAMSPESSSGGEPNTHPVPDLDAEYDIPVGRHRRRFARGTVVGRVVAAVIGVVLGLGVIAGLQLVQGEEKPPSGRDSFTPPDAQARVSADKAPSDVRIDDKGTTVVVSWNDRTDNAAPHYVVGGPRGATPRALAQVKKGVEEVTIDSLDPKKDYCFTVIAVLSVDEVAPATPACTDRG